MRAVVAGLVVFGCLVAGACGYLVWLEFLTTREWVVTASGSAADEARRSPEAFAARLQARAAAVSPGIEPTVAPTDTGEFSVTLYGHPRGDEATAFALSTPGAFSAVASADGEDVELFGKRDVAQASVGFTGEGQPVLNLLLTDDAGLRVRRWSERHVGSTVRLLLDGEVIASAVASGPFSTRIQIGIPDATADDVWSLASVVAAPVLPAGLEARRAE